MYQHLIPFCSGGAPICRTCWFLCYKSHHGWLWYHWTLTLLNMKLGRDEHKLAWPIPEHDYIEDAIKQESWIKLPAAPLTLAFTWILKATRNVGPQEDQTHCGMLKMVMFSTEVSLFLNSTFISSFYVLDTVLNTIWITSFNCVMVLWNKDWD